MHRNSFGYGGGSKVNVAKDLYNDKKYNIKIDSGSDGGIGVEERNKNIVFFKLLSRLELWVGFTTNKEYNSAFFYVKDDFCSLRDFLKRNEERYGYGNGYNETSVGGYLSYDEAVFMVDSLCQQIMLFSGSGSGWGFYCFLLDNVYVVDNHKFIYLGIEHLVEIKGGEVRSGEKTINFTIPFPEKMMIMRGGGDIMKLFICPEIKNMNQLPVKVLYSSTYYHLASLIIYCMFHKNLCFGGGGVDGGVDGGVVGGILSAIVNTKLYWFLIRCLHKDPSKRILLWI